MSRQCLKAHSFHLDRYHYSFAESPRMYYHAPKVYSSNKIFVEHWDKHVLAEPKDRDPYKDGTSNFLSTYNHLGSYPDEPMISETRSMTEQIRKKSKYEYDAPSPMFNILSYCMSETPKKRKALIKTGIVEFPSNYGYMDYLTESSASFINYFPVVTKKEEEKEPEINFFRFHKSLSEFTDAACDKRTGCNKFLDDNLNQFYKFSRCFKKKNETKII